MRALVPGFFIRKSILPTLPGCEASYYRIHRMVVQRLDSRRLRLKVIRAFWGWQ